METLPSILDAIGKTSKAYIDALETMTKAIESLPKMEAWVENWRKTTDAFAPGFKLGEAWRETAWKQAQLVQQTMQEGVGVWLRLWRTANPRSPS